MSPDNDFHSEIDYIPSVLEACYDNGGTALWADIFTYVDATMPLNESDRQDLPSNGIRYHRQNRNLMSHQTLVKMGLATNIPNGFQLTALGVECVKAGNSNHFLRQLVDIKSTRDVVKFAVWKAGLKPSLKDFTSVVAHVTRAGFTDSFLRRHGLTAIIAAVMVASQYFAPGLQQAA